jgi:hypothetical protein
MGWSMPQLASDLDVLVGREQHGQPGALMARNRSAPACRVVRARGAWSQVLFGGGGLEPGEPVHRDDLDLVAIRPEGARDGSAESLRSS